MKRTALSFAFCLWIFATSLIISHKGFHNFSEFWGKITILKTVHIISHPLKPLQQMSRSSQQTMGSLRMPGSFLSEKWVGEHFLVVTVTAMVILGKTAIMITSTKWYTGLWNATWIFARREDNQLQTWQTKHTNAQNQGVVLLFSPPGLKEQCQEKEKAVRMTFCFFFFSNDSVRKQEKGQLLQKVQVLEEKMRMGWICR